MSNFYIIDTNAVVAGLLTAHVGSPVARILDGILRATFPFVGSEELLIEYRAVLLRPKLCKLHGLSDAEIDAILTDLSRHAIVLAPRQPCRGAPRAGLGRSVSWGFARRPVRLGADHRRQTAAAS